MLLDSSSNSDRLVTMCQVLESCPTLTLANCSPCKLDATLDYRVVVLHLDSFTLSLGEDRSLPALGFLSFRDSERGSWSVPLSPEGREGEVDLGSVYALSIHRESSGDWVYGPDNQPCIGERAALLSLLESLEQGGKPLLVLTPRTGSLELLLAALETHGLGQEWEARVQGVGSVEEILTARSLLKFSASGLSQLEELCGSPLSPPHTVPKTLYTLLETQIPSFSSSLLQHMHPLLSPYTQSVLLSSSLPHLSPYCHGVSLSSPHLLAPGAQLLAMVLLAPTARLEIDQRMEYTGFMGLHIQSEMDRLGSSLLVQVTLRNTSSHKLKLKAGERIGLIARKGVLYWPSQDLSSLSGPSSSPPLPAPCLPAPSVATSVAPSDQEGQLTKRKHVDTAAVRREIQQLSKQLERSQKSQQAGSSKQKSSVLDRYKLLKKKIQEEQLVELGDRGSTENNVLERNPLERVELEECITEEVELSPRYIVSSDEESELETSTINQSNAPSNDARCQFVSRVLVEGKQQGVEIVGKDPSRKEGQGKDQDVFLSPLPAQLSLDSVAKNLSSPKIHNPVVEVVEIDDSDSEDPSQRNNVPNQFGSADILTIDDTEDSEDIQIHEVFMEVQIRNAPAQQVEVLEVEDDEDAIQILPMKGARVHFYASGCAVADPETLRQTIEAYRRKQKKCIDVADAHRSTDLSNCEIEILECGQAEEEDLFCEEPIGSKVTVENITITEEENTTITEEENTTIFEEENTTVTEEEITTITEEENTIITEEDKVSYILELVPDMEEEREKQRDRLIGKKNTIDNISESMGIATEIYKIFPEAEEVITDSFEIVAQSNKIIPKCVELVPDRKKIVPDGKEISTDVYWKASQNKDIVTQNIEIVSIHEESGRSESDQISQTSCESESEKESINGGKVVKQTEKLKDESNIYLSSSCDEGRESGGEELNFPMMSEDDDLDAESLECTPDLESMVEYEKRKKIDLRMQKPQSPAEGDDRSRNLRKYRAPQISDEVFKIVNIYPFIQEYY